MLSLKPVKSKHLLKLIPLIIYDIISGGPGLDETLHTVITGENFTIIVTYRKLNTM